MIREPRETVMRDMNRCDELAIRAGKKSFDLYVDMAIAIGK